MRNASPLFFILILFFACNTPGSGLETGEYEVSKTNLLKMEQSTPAKFLFINGDIKRNIVGQTVVRGTLKNNATIAKFKDVSIRFNFYSKTKTLVQTEEETIYDFLFPGETTHFKSKFFAPKGIDSVAMVIIGASVEE